MQAQECTHRLKIVLDPVMYLAQRRILAQERSLATPEIRDVSHQHYGAGGTTLGIQGHRAHRDAGRGIFHFRIGSHPAAGRQGESLVDGARAMPQARRQRSQIRTLQRTRKPKAAERRHRIGARESHPAMNINGDESISHAGRGGQISNGG